MPLPPENQNLPNLPERPHRRPFEGHRTPKPLHRTSEFQIFIWLLGVFAIVGIIGVYFFSIASRKATSQRSAADRSNASNHPLNPVELAAREVSLNTLFEGSLADTRNGQGFAETSGYHRLLEILMSYPPEQVAHLAARRLDWAAATADPDAWRGEFVWTRGIIAHRWAERLRNPVFGVQDVYRVILTDGDGSDGVMVDMLEEPPRVALQRDPVDVQGIFYRTVRYPNAARKTQEQEAPYLLVKTMRPVEGPKRSAVGYLRDHFTAAALVGLAIAFGAARLLIYAFQRRSRRPGTTSRAGAGGFRKMFEKRLRDENRTAGPRSKA